MICWILVAANMAILISVILLVCLICNPIAYIFDKKIPDGHCGGLLQFELYTSISNLTMDAITVIVPMPMHWRLQMQIKMKTGLTIVLRMGAMWVSAEVADPYALGFTLFSICILTLTRVLAILYYEANDYTKQSVLVALITGLELILGIINACLSFLPSVLKRVGQTTVFIRASIILKSTARKFLKGQGPCCYRQHRGPVL